MNTIVALALLAGGVMDAVVGAVTVVVLEDATDRAPAAPQKRMRQLGLQLRRPLLDIGNAVCPRSSTRKSGTSRKGLIMLAALGAVSTHLAMSGLYIGGGALTVIVVIVLLVMRG